MPVLVADARAAASPTTTSSDTPASGPVPVGDEGGPGGAKRRGSSCRSLRVAATVLSALASWLPADRSFADGPVVSIDVGDGSIPNDPVVTVELRMCGGPVPQLEYNVPWGTSTLLWNCCYECTDARAKSTPYFTPPWTNGVIHCVWPSPGCGGSYTTSMYSTQGSITGTVTRVPEGTPVAGVEVQAIPSGQAACIGYWKNTDTNGQFSFRNPFYLPNNWGLPVEGDGSGPGSRTYFVTADVCSTGASATIFSNVNVDVDITVTSAYMEETSDRPCSEESSSPTAPPAAPSAEGRPVSVVTGNVFFDQTDASFRGVARGGLGFTRSYNSITSSSGYGIFGPGWNHAYERRLAFPAPAVVMLRNASGVPQYFQDSDGDNLYRASVPFTETSTLNKQVDGSYVRSFPAGGSETYDAAGRLTAIIDATGNTVMLTYVADKLSTIADPGGRALTLGYTGERVTSLSGPGGLLATYGYDGLGRLSSVTYPDSPADPDTLPDGGYIFEYDGVSGRLWQLKDLTGRVVETHLYDADGKAETSEISGGMEKYTFTYEPNRTTVESRRSAGQPQPDISVYEWASYYGMKRVTRITGRCGSCGPGTGGDVQEWQYDAKGRVSSYKDGDGNVTSYDYDQATGELLSETRPLSHVTSYTYYPDGRVKTRTAPNGQVTTWTYVPAGPETITEQLTATQSRTTTFHYHAGASATPGKLQWVDDPRAKRTSFTYYPSGDLETITDPLGTPTPDPNDHVTRFEYDALGRRTAVVDPLGRRTETTYNAPGQVLQVRQFDDGRPIDVSFEYDQGGRRSRSTDGNGHVTDYDYDAYGRLWHVVQPVLDGGTRPTTTYGYDLVSNLYTLTDAESRTTTFDHDAHNRVQTITYPSSGAPRVESFTYDSAGRVKTKTDRNGVVGTYEYDDLGRVISKTYSDGSPGTTFAYDEDGHVGYRTSATGGGRVQRWAYDLAGRVLREQTFAVGQPTPLATVEYAYDATDNREELKLDGQVYLTYTYDDASRLETMWRGTREFVFGYDDAHQRTSLTYPNGVVASYEYDDLSRLKDLHVQHVPATITRSQYTYDDAGNRLTKTHPEYSESYGYDALDRLELVTGGGQTVESFGYDKVANRVSSSGEVWTYNERNELLWQGAEANFSYDLAGNVIQKWGPRLGTTTYAWHASGALDEVVTPSEQVSFAYDALGRRTLKDTKDGATTYYYDDEDILFETRAGTVTKYLHGPGIDEPLAAEDASGNLTYFHADGLGSVLKTTDEAAAVMAARRYLSFGVPVPESEPGYAFTGREWDPETGLYYYRARYYDPKIGRFLSEDPVRFKGGINFYAYVGNNPATLVDPFGLQMPPPEIQQFLEGAAMMFWDYRKMVKANTIGVDKYYHCLANCEAASWGPGGIAAATLISSLREDYSYWKGDPLWDSMEDMRANACGRQAAPDCSVCNRYLPPWYSPTWP